MMYQNKPLTVFIQTQTMFVKEFFIYIYNILLLLLLVLHFNDNVTVNLMNLYETMMIKK